MKIRIAETADIATLFEIRTSVTENHQSLEAIAQQGITPASVAQMLVTDCRAWIAEIDNRPIGFSIANGRAQSLLGLFVLPPFARRGVGRALIEIAEEWLWSQGATEIWLLTANNPRFRAYGFYLHMGWTPVGVEANRDEMKFIKRRSPSNFDHPH